MKRLLCTLLALCMLTALASAEEKPVRYEEIIALREKLAGMYAELTEMENRLAEMTRLYKIQNANRRIVFEQDSWTMLNGYNMRLAPDVVRVKDDAPGRTELRFESSDSAVVWIDRENGRAYAKSPGVAEITCWALDDPDVFNTVEITVIEPVESVRLKEGSVSLFIRGSGEDAEKGTLQLEATVKPDNATDRSLKWTSSDEAVVQVTGEGLLLAQSLGRATVTAEAVDGSGKRATVTVKVVKGVEALVLNCTETTVSMGKKLRLSAVFTPEDAGEQTLRWESSDTSVATVTSRGVVYPERPGTCTITATTTDGTEISAECVVTVEK